ncbi:MAG: VanW family protein [Oscillospiraceae bacterium]|nr:VanW family protein [Oscillospiraceae bacterium]
MPKAEQTAAQRHADAQEKGAKRPNGKKIGIIAGATVLALVLGICVFGFVLKGGQTIYPNVTVADINVGGLNRMAAIAAVEEAVAAKSELNTLSVVLPDRTLEFTPDVTNVALDAEGAIDAALRYGRDGGPFKAVFTYLGAGGRTHTVSLQSEMELDTEYIRNLIDETAEDAKSELIQPVVKIDEEAGKISIKTGSAKVRLDADALYEQVIARFEAQDFSDLKFEYDSTPCKPIDLEGYYEKYCTEVIDAHFDEEAGKLVEEQVGFGFDLPYYTQQIAMAEPETEIVIEMKDLEPKVTLEQLKAEMFPDVLAKYDSPHVNIPARTANLDLACKAIDGMILKPGDVFSFNDAVGERTVEKGYQAATVYLDGGKSQAETGGGICQVASTIYECVLYANLKVTERMPHMFVVTYVGYGQDATIYWGQQDFKFQNNTEHPIRIDASVSGGYVHITLAGVKEETNYDSIKISYAVLSQKEWKTVGVLNKDDKEEVPFEITIDGDIATDAAGNTYKVEEVIDTPYTGMSIMTYRHFLDAEGKEISKETLAKSDYRSRDKKVLLTLLEPAQPEDGEYDEEGNYTGDPSVTPGEDEEIELERPNEDEPMEDEDDRNDGPVDFGDPDTW